jgi:hypothetical protein
MAFLRNDALTAVQRSLGLFNVMPCRLLDHYHLQDDSSPLSVNSVALHLSYNLNILVDMW